MSLKDQIQDDMKAAMRAKEKERLTTVRMLLAAIKQKEVDEQTAMDDNSVLSVIEKMVKQRRDAIKQYEDAGRTELADKEKREIAVLQDYLPAQMDDSEIASLIEEAISACGAKGPQDMGKLMGYLKPKAQGRADMSKVSQLVKAKLTA